MFLQIGCKITKNFRQHHNPKPHHPGLDRSRGPRRGFPLAKHIAILLLLGFVAYGLSIYCYTYAQRTIGAALSFLLLGETLTPLFLVATAVMAAGCWLAAQSDC